MTQVETQTLPLLRADPHQWGPGAVHRYDPDKQQTLCGKTLANCPGRLGSGRFDDISCKGCLRSIEAAAKAEQRRREWAAESAERERQYAARLKAWREAYSLYLRTPVWRRKRWLVLNRSGGMCEGCRERQATQVHHLRYPDSWPGDPDWIAQEKLFDLVAICDDCHEDVHGRSLEADRVGRF